ncbi:hypothetical protein EBL89_17110 [Cereibacter sphaeroides]|uniref:hypothetical protein n=1 Tax=Cereibacter sphaeroides TaxID=1063 RepID=UPI0005663340|nr:hypothetical protein [Cereibacter sphaeroides]AZB57029.1 hypothetical protein EBL89_17110 [Cereibacter sphaeroides]AZB61283.1 hypothetical protein EBL88_17040 [Cereibacter sphaeroides]
MTSKLLTAAFVGMIALAGGCTTETVGHSTKSAPSGFSVSNKTPKEISLEKQVKSLNQQSRDIVVRNTVEGAMAGAVVGCGVALLFGGNGDDCVKGAAAGAIVGGVGGNAVGQQAAQKNRDLVKRDEVLAKLKGINASLGSVQTNLRDVLRSQNAEIASLQRQVGANQITQSAYDKRVRAINSNRTAVVKGLQTAETNVSKERMELVSLEKQGGQSLSTLRSAASSTEKRLASLRSTVSLIPTK